ncbi:MAG: PIN domain-containing protein [Spirochaetaceae bacterium]|nr:PIN domain-containing protein [Spirochaetaceae bacterium]
MLFLDTDILSYLLANDEAVINRVAAWRDGQPAITAITVYEVLKGFRHKPRPKKETMFNEFLRKIRVYPLDDEAIRIAADSYGALSRIEKPCSNTDILLAAIVMRNGGTLYTNNIRHFESIPHLKLLR